MKKNHICLAALLASVAFTSCVKESGYENNPAEGSGLPIEFTIPAQTKALLDTEDGKTVTFEDGDVVGLFAYYAQNGSSTKTVSPTGKNVPYKYEASTDRFVPVGEPATWGGTSSDDHNLYVYYPYDENAEGICNSDTKFSHTLSTTQVYDAAATTSDIVDYGFAWSRLQPATYGKPVKFDALKQFYSIFRLNIENNTEQDVKVNSVELNVDSGYLSNRFDFYLNSTDYAFSGDTDKNAKYNAGGTPQLKITSTVENGEITAGGNIDVRLMIRPADYTGKTFTVTVKTDKGDYTTTFGGGTIGAGARAYKNIKLAADGGSEEEPAPSTYSIGDTVEGGVLYWISDDKTTGKVLYPYRGESDVFTTESSLLSGLTISQTDGAANVKALKGVDPTLAKFPGARYCDELEGDWYLPSQNELRTVFSVYNGTGTTENWDNVTNAKPSAITDKETAAREIFDGYILDCASNGVVLNTQADDRQGDMYWSSTWSTSNARAIRFGQRADLGTEFSTKCYARCIKVVDLSAAAE